MLHPFFECTFSLVGNKDISNMSSGWLNAMCVNSVGVWSCFVGDMGGSIEVYKKGNEGNEVDGHVASFTGQLTKYARWERVHRLGISGLVVASEDNYLVTLSYDCTCKILDASQGQTIYCIENQRRCMFTGVLWKPQLMTCKTRTRPSYLAVCVAIFATVAGHSLFLLFAPFNCSVSCRSYVCGRTGLLGRV